MIFMGAPLLANIQVAALYPPDTLFYLLPTTEAIRWSVVLHLFLGAAFTYLFARVSLGLSPAASWLAGACLGLGGFLGAHVGHLNQLHAAVWLPLLLLCLERATTRRSLVAVSAGGVVAATQLLAGHTQEVYYSYLALGLFACYLSAFGGGRGWGRLWPLGVVSTMLLLGGTISGVQLLPTLELARESYRSGGIPYPEAVVYSVPPREMLDSILPLYFQMPYLELVGYTGIVSVVLVPAALVSLRRGALPLFFGGMALLALGLSLGGFTPLYSVLYRWFPGFDLFRAPGRWLFIFSFSTAILAAIGLDALREKRDGAELARWLARYALALCLGLGSLLALRLFLGVIDQEPSWPHPRAVLTWSTFALSGIALSMALAATPRSRFPVILILTLALSELYLAKEPLEYNRSVPASLYESHTSLSMGLDGMEPQRMLSLAGEEFEVADPQLAPPTGPLDPGEVTAYLRNSKLKETIPPNLGMAMGLATPDGYDGGLLPTRQYAQLKQSLLQPKDPRSDLTLRDGLGPLPSGELLSTLGVDYLLVNVHTGEQTPGWTEIPGQSEKPLRVLRNSTEPARAQVVHQAVIMPDDSQSPEDISSLDLSQIVLLHDEVQFDEPATQGRDTLSLVEDWPREVVFDVETEQPGFLVLSDSYYPGWRVHVDDREEQLLRANFALRAVQLQPGRHRVRFSYEPASLALGLGLSLMGILIAVALPVVGRQLSGRRGRTMSPS